MHHDDITSFFASRDLIDRDAYLELTFTFECAGDPRVAAAHLASEQSTAQWRRIGVDEDFRPRFGAKVLELDATPVAGFSVPLAITVPGPVHRCRAVIAHPHGNFGARLPNLISAVLGEGIFFAPGIPVIRLEDVRFPDSFLAQFEGPQFGVAGVRQHLQAYDRPIFFGVIKPTSACPPSRSHTLATRGGWAGSTSRRTTRCSPMRPTHRSPSVPLSSARRDDGPNRRPASRRAISPTSPTRWIVWPRCTTWRCRPARTS
jgi:ribulose-bisphosphate carboxylase large chain